VNHIFPVSGHLFLLFKIGAFQSGARLAVITNELADNYDLRVYFLQALVNSSAACYYICGSDGMASNKKGSYAGTDHLYGSFWKHLRKEGKRQFWKKERHLAGINNKNGGDTEKAPPVPAVVISNKDRKKGKKDRLQRKVHKRLINAIDKRARERG
jgi:hypothetical protein